MSQVESNPMQGKIVLVTGSTDGIGKQTALELARMGASVIVHGRNAQKARAVRDEIARATGNDQLDFVAADLASLAEVRAMAAAVKAKAPRLDILINNAGVIISQRTLTVDGLEATLAINHFSHFLLTNLLLDATPAPARIVHVSSQVHRNGQIDFDNLQGERDYNGRMAYCHSKLANVLFSHELAARLAGKGVTSNSLHPGVISTKLLHGGFGGGGDSLELGAETPVYLAASPEVEGITGEYFTRKRIAETHPAAHDIALRQKLWQISEQLCGLA